MKIRCIAVDDEHPALLKIENYIAKVPFLELVSSFDNAIDALDYLKNNTVDLVFLDIEMEEFTGVQLLKVLKNKPKIILTTAYDQYAVQAFELEVSDYLLKPISFERFMKSVEKVYDQLLEKKTAVIEEITTNEIKYKEDYIFVKTEYSMKRIDFSKILYIEGLKEYLSIFTTNERVITLQNFKTVEDVLPKENFIRVHRSYIVSIKKIDSVDKNRVLISDKTIPIGDSYKKEFFSMLEKRKL
jgi:DNA-binding LytR/AlgR family response regulator